MKWQKLHLCLRWLVIQMNKRVIRIGLYLMAIVAILETEGLRELGMFWTGIILTSVYEWVRD